MDFMNDDELKLQLNQNLFNQLNLDEDEQQESMKKVEEVVDDWKNMEFVTTEKRLLYILLVDHSGSTSTFINEINDGLRNLVRTTQQHEGADAFDLMVFPFSTNVEELINSPVRDVDLDAIKPLKPEGFTRLDLALKTAYEETEGYKNGLGRNKMNPDYWRPYIIIISDGLPTDEHGKYLDAEGRNRLVKICRDTIEYKHASIFTFFVGRDQDGADFLKQLASPGSAFQIESTGEKIHQMFELLSESVRVTQAKKTDFTDPQFEP